MIQLLVLFSSEKDMHLGYGHRFSLGEFCTNTGETVIAINAPLIVGETDRVDVCDVPVRSLDVQAGFWVTLGFSNHNRHV